MPEFEINADIRRARTIPSRFYLSEKFFELSKERIFARSWQLAGLKGDISTLHPISFLPGILDEPLLITTNDDRLGCFSNVCTHRGMPLVESPVDGSLIRCGYHGRRFSLDGKFLSMPEFEGVCDFPSAEDDLAAAYVAEFGGFVFVAIDPIAPIEEMAGSFGASFFAEHDGRLKLTAVRDYFVSAHWALYCENYLEGFHIPYVHPSLNKIVDFDTYTTETFRYSSVQTGYDNEGQVAGRFFFVFPNLMFNFYPWGISVNLIEPLSPERTRVRFLTYVSDAEKLETGAGKDLDNVELEDEAVVEAVQRGLRSRFYDTGRYSPNREQGTHHFHRLIAEFIG